MNLTNHFLIAMPTLNDPNFKRTVTYLCSHNNQGAMGIVLNRPLDMSLGEMLEQMDIDACDPKTTSIQVIHGGPVLPERGFVLHRPAGEWDAMFNIEGTKLAIATSRDILRAMANGDGPEEAVVALGYAGWGAGQLERELNDNVWLSGPADERIIFELPYEERWEGAARLLGVRVERLSAQVGHA